MVMKSATTLGYAGKHSEVMNPAKKFQVFTVFDPSEANNFVKGIKENLNPDQALLGAYHGVKDTQNMDEVNAWLLPKNQPELASIYTRIAAAVKEANKVWNFELNASENMHMTEFGVTNNTEWHLDGFEHNTIRRKLSYTVMLSDPADYRGGSVELWYGSDRIELPRVKKGEMLIWPSFLLHRIASVKRGPRYALHGWAFGKEGFK